MATEHDEGVRESGQAEGPENVTPTIYELMPKVAQSIGAIHKSRQNTQQNFRFRGIDDVMTAVQPALVEYGVFYVPRVLHAEHERYQTKNGTGMRSATITVEFTFYGPSGDHVVGVGIGEAADAGDKATSKALAMALKYALLQTFCVPTGDPDPDAQNVENASGEPRARRSSSRRSAPEQKAAPATAIAPTVQAWLDAGHTRAEIIRLAADAARANSDKPPTRVEQINVDTLKAETLAALSASMRAREQGAGRGPENRSQELSQTDPPGCPEHNPYEPQCDECKAILASRQGALT